MATIKAFIRTSKKITESNIRIRLKDGRDIDICGVTPLKIASDKWSNKTESINSRVVYDNTQRNIFDKSITDLKASIFKTLETTEKEDVNANWLNTEIDKYYNPKKYKPVVAAEEKPITLFEFIEDFLKNAPQRKVSKSGTLMNKDAIVQHQITFDYLKKFAVYKKKTNFDFSDMNKSFYDEFVKYMQSKDLASNTIGQKIKHLKLWLNESYKLELHTEVKYKTAFEGMQEKSDNVALDEVELQKLFDLDFSNEKTEAAYKYKTLISDKLALSYKLETLDQVRDGFLLECWTGCRFSDLGKITKKNIKNGLISIKQQKTGTEVIIPLHPMSVEILEKYDYNPPKPVSNQRFNDMIKIICRIAEIDNKEKKEITKGGVKQINYFEKWKLISSHTGRRSFATNNYRMGLDTYTIMRITGHKTESSFLKYIKVDANEHAHRMLDHWNKLYSIPKNDEVGKENE
ncbi:MAG: tyrosine-type recombinase/integrase [Paludibacter sp.]|jgi:integrase